MPRLVFSQQDAAQKEKSIALQQQFLSAERNTHPKEVTDREISLLSDILSKKLWSFDKIADMMEATVSRGPSQQQIATLMRGGLPFHSEYWTALYRCQQDDNDDGVKELGRNIIKAAAEVAQKISDSFNYDSEFTLVGFYKGLINHKDHEESKNDMDRRGFSVNPELTALMVSKLNQKLTSCPELYIETQPIKDFLNLAAPRMRSHTNGASACRSLMKTIHNVENKILKDEQAQEDKSLAEILGFQMPARSTQKE